jgi:hypothetical protein
MAELVDGFESTSSVFGGVLGGHGGWLVGMVVEGALGWTHVGWVPWSVLGAVVAGAGMKGMRAAHTGNVGRPAVKLNGYF